MAKVFVAYPGSMKVKEVKCEGLQATVVQRAAEKNFKSVLFAIMNSSETASLAREVFKMKIATECGSYAKQKNSLNTTDPALIAEFRNSTFVKEVEMKTPFLYSALQGGVKEDIDFNKIALGASSCLSTRVKSSAYLTRNTVILQHGGCKARDISRLNQLGICSSHKTSIRVQNRMGEAFDEDITEWKEDIEETKKNIRLLEEVKKAQVPVIGEDDMEVDVSIDFSKDTLSGYKYYADDVFEDCGQLLQKACYELRSDLNQDVVERVLNQLKSRELPTYRWVFLTVFKIFEACKSKYFHF